MMLHRGMQLAQGRCEGRAMNIASYFGFDFSCRGLLCVFVSH